MGRIATKVEKTFDNDKVGMSLANNFERLSRVAGLYVTKDVKDDRIVITTYDEYNYMEEDIDN